MTSCPKCGEPVFETEFNYSPRFQTMRELLAEAAKTLELVRGTTEALTFEDKTKVTATLHRIIQHGYDR